MTKATKLSEYKKGYDLITDDELNGLFIGFDKDSKARILQKQNPCTYYAFSFINNATSKLCSDAFVIDNLDKIAGSIEKHEKAATKIANSFIKKHPNTTPILSIFSFAGQFSNPKTKEPYLGLLISGQTADGRCCMILHKMVTDKDGKIIDFDTINEHIPKKHTNDEEYIWEGNEKLLKIINKLTNKKS